MRATHGRNGVIRSLLLALFTATLLAAVLFLGVLVGSAESSTKQRCNTSACHARVAYRRCSQANPRACVEYAIRRYRLIGWQAQWMRRIPRCESGYNPYARNPSGASGLYQFMPGTWYGTPYGRHSIWSARHQALAAAWMLTRGRSGEWVCRL